jgi:hypothetical protein
MVCESARLGAHRGAVVQIAGSACAFHRPAARSVWPRTNDLGALDLSARSGADRVYDAGANRSLFVSRGVSGRVEAAPWGAGVAWWSGPGVTCSEVPVLRVQPATQD